MNNGCLSACVVVIVLATSISAVSANDDRSYDYRYYGGNWHQNNYGPDTAPPGSVVRYLERQDYRHISKPMRSGRFYQVKAINSYGHKVRLYIDAHSGRIVDVKG
jgi:hypothetical protein